MLALKSTPESDRAAIIDCLVRGLVKAAQPEAPLWGVLRQSQGAADPSMVMFARGLETTLSLKIAEAKAPGAPAVIAVPELSPQQPSSNNTATVPGG